MGGGGDIGIKASSQKIDMKNDYGQTNSEQYYYQYGYLNTQCSNIKVSINIFFSFQAMFLEVKTYTTEHQLVKTIF